MKYVFIEIVFIRQIQELYVIYLSEVEITNNKEKTDYDCNCHSDIDLNIIVNYIHVYGILMRTFTSPTCLS